MKRVLFLHHVSSIGGGSYCLLNILKEVDKSYMEPIVCLASDGPLRNEVEILGIKVIIFERLTPIPYNKSFLKCSSIQSYTRIYSSFRTFMAILEENRIDAVYINNMMLYSYLKPSKRCGCKTIIHIREHWPTNEHTFQLDLARRYVKRYADQLIAINRYSASMFPESQATIVYDWIDFSERYEERLFDDIFGQDASKLKVLLFTGGLDSMKGTYEVLSAFSNNIKGDDYRLLVMGMKDIVLRNSMKHKFKMLLRKFGYFYYLKSLSEIILNDKRIVCVPATYKLKHIIEQSAGFVSYFTVPHANLALAENIILGNACLAAKTQESEEYTYDGAFAKLVIPNDLAQFAEDLVDFVNNLEFFKAKAMSGAKILAEKFDPKQNVYILNNAIRIILEC